MAAVLRPGDIKAHIRQRQRLRVARRILGGRITSIDPEPPSSRGWLPVSGGLKADVKTKLVGTDLRRADVLEQMVALSH